MKHISKCVACPPARPPARFSFLLQVEGLRAQLLRAKKVAGETAEDQKRLQRELDSAAGAVEDRTRLQQRFVLLVHVLGRGKKRAR